MLNNQSIKTPLPQLSVVIPMHNEIDNAEPLIEEIIAELSPWAECEIIAVDDCSTDGTHEKLLELKSQYPELRVLRHRVNLGQSSAVVSGVYAARYSLIATLDGDGQNPPADIQKLFRAMEEQVLSAQQLLIAGHRQNRNDSPLRLISSKIANSIRSKFLNDTCADSGCGLKLFSKTTFLKLPHFDHLHRFLPALFIRAGATVVNVPISHRPRTRGYSKYGVMNRLWVGIIDLFGTAWLIRRPCPSDLHDEL